MEWQVFLDRLQIVHDDMHETNSSNILVHKFKSKINNIKKFDGFASAMSADSKSINYIYRLLQMCHMFSSGMNAEQAYLDSLGQIDKPFVRAIISKSLRHIRIKKQDISESDIQWIKQLVDVCGAYLALDNKFLD